MEATQQESVSEGVETARTLLHHLQEKKILGKGFFCTTDPKIMAMRVSAASTAAEMPQTEEVESSNGMKINISDAKEFLQLSSIHLLNYEYFLDNEIVKVSFHKGVLEEYNSGLTPQSISLAFFIVCDPKRIHNGAPCCNRTPSYSNLPNQVRGKVLRSQLKRVRGVFEDKELW